jgi:hypothetical protein
MSCLRTVALPVLAHFDSRVGLWTCARIRFDILFDRTLVY